MATGAVITNGGQNLALYRTFTSNPTQTAIVRFRIGGDTATPAQTDTAMTKTFLINASNYNTMDTTTGWSSSGVGTGPTINTTAGQRVEGSGCLNLTTNDSGAATWYNVTTTLTNLASTYHSLMFYNENVTNNLQNVSNAVSVTLGNNSTNTNSSTYNFHRSDLSNGWNPLLLYVPSPSISSGTFTATSISYFAINVNNNSTMSGTAQRMDIWKYGAASDRFKTFESGWPTFNTTNKTVESKGYLTSIQGNNYSITSWSLENSDSTPVMWSKDVTAALDKSSGEEVAIIWTDQASQG